MKEVLTEVDLSVIFGGQSSKSSEDEILIVGYAFV